MGGVVGLGEDGVLVPQAALASNATALHTDTNRANRASEAETSGTSFTRQAQAWPRLVFDGFCEAPAVAGGPSWNWPHVVRTRRPRVP